MLKTANNLVKLNLKKFKFKKLYYIEIIVCAANYKNITLYTKVQDFNYIKCALCTMQYLPNICMCRVFPLLWERYRTSRRVCTTGLRVTKRKKKKRLIKSALCKRRDNSVNYFSNQKRLFLWNRQIPTR